jgi:hypothetical protein
MPQTGVVPEQHVIDVREPIEQLAAAYATRLSLIRRRAGDAELAESWRHITRLERACQLTQPLGARTALHEDPASYLG